MQPRDWLGFLAASCLCLGTTFSPLAAHAKDVAGPVTIPMRLELDRPYIDVTLTGPNRQHVKAHAYVDTGGGAIILSSDLAKRLGLKANGKASHEEGQTLIPTATPALDIGDRQVETADAHALIDASEPHTLGRTDAEMALPGRYLRHYIVVFDYPAQTFTLADPDSYKPDGTAIETTFGSGMPVVHISVDDESHGFLLDTGGQYCMISTANLGAWRKQHSDWPRVEGTYGPADMQMGRLEAKLYMQRIAALQWGPFRIENAGAVSRGVGNYERGMSGIVGTPIIGSIGGNVLSHFKVTVDYRAQKVYLDGPATVRDAPLDMVGIVLEPAAHGGYEVAGTADGVKGIQVGDRLLKVDGKTVARAPFSTVVNMLSGSPGTPRTLSLQRGGTRFNVHATVQTIL